MSVAASSVTADMQLHALQCDDRNRAEFNRAKTQTKYDAKRNESGNAFVLNSCNCNYGVGQLKLAG